MSAKSVLHIKHPQVPDIGTGKSCGQKGKTRILFKKKKKNNFERGPSLSTLLASMLPECAAGPLPVSYSQRDTKGGINCCAASSIFGDIRVEGGKNGGSAWY